MAEIERSIPIKQCTAGANVGAATTLILETQSGARLTLDSGAEGSYAVYEGDGEGNFKVSRDSSNAAITITLSPDAWTPLPTSLFSAGWLRFVGTAAPISAKVMG